MIKVMNIGGKPDEKLARIFPRPVSQEEKLKIKRQEIQKKIATQAAEIKNYRLHVNSLEKELGMVPTKWVEDE